MKRTITTFAAVLLVLAAFAQVASAQTATPTATATATATATPNPATLTSGGFSINGATSAVPIPVGTSTPVTVLAPAPSAGTPGARCNWCMTWTEAYDLICQPIPYPQATPAVLPAGTNGYRFRQNGGAICASAVGGDTTLGWSCIGTGAVNVYTAEFERCTHKGDNP
jgi:hypothetical protein